MPLTAVAVGIIDEIRHGDAARALSAAAAAATPTPETTGLDAPHAPEPPASASAADREPFLIE